MRSLLFASLMLAGCDFGQIQNCDDPRPYVRSGTFVTAAAMDAPLSQLRVEVTAYMERDTGEDEENTGHAPQCFTEAVSGVSLTARSSQEVTAFEDLGNGDYRATLVGYEPSYSIEHNNGMEIVAMPKPFDPVVDWPTGQALTLRWTVEERDSGRITFVGQAPDGSMFAASDTYLSAGSLTIPAAVFAQPGTYRLTVTHASNNGYGWERTFARSLDVVAP